MSLPAASPHPPTAHTHLCYSIRDLRRTSQLAWPLCGAHLVAYDGHADPKAGLCLFLPSLPQPSSPLPPPPSPIVRAKVSLEACPGLTVCVWGRDSGGRSQALPPPWSGPQLFPGPGQLPERGRRWQWQPANVLHIPHHSLFTCSSHPPDMGRESPLPFSWRDEPAYPSPPSGQRGDHHAPPSWGPGLPGPQYICISKPHNAGGRGAVGARLGEAMWVQREGLRPPPISGACHGAL